MSQKSTVMSEKLKMETQISFQKHFSSGFDRPIVMRRGYSYPHKERENAIYHIGFRLYDSIPQTTIRELQIKRVQMKTRVMEAQGQLSEYDCEQIDRLFSSEIERLIDNGYGSCIFNENKNCEIMCNVLTSDSGSKYELYAWCIMPNHIHVLMSLLEKNKLADVVHAWKSAASHLINKKRNAIGRLWQRDYFNRIIRDYNHYLRTKEYIWNNPDKAGLHDWSWRWKTHGVDEIVQKESPAQQLNV